MNCDADLAGCDVVLWVSRSTCAGLEFFAWPLTSSLFSDGMHSGHPVSAVAAFLPLLSPWVGVALQLQADLDAMRRNLGDSIEYFEADLTAYSSIRRLMEVTAANNAGARPPWASNPDSEPAAWKPTPVEVETIPSPAPTVAVTTAPAATATNGSLPAAAATNASKPTGNGTTVLPAPAPLSVNSSGGDLVASIQPYYEDYIATIQPYEVSGAAGEHSCACQASSACHSQVLLCASVPEVVSAFPVPATMSISLLSLLSALNQITVLTLLQDQRLTRFK
eukprot:GHUV01029622.1.p2 GENE.GHUV01029622.1~~GHUV01029622.1.p2  ORF type:complete len:279 (+),score=87.45 GHUV01029622.1:1130-1966(+)